MTTTPAPEQLGSPIPAGDSFINLVEAATLRQERTVPAVLLNTLNSPAFSSPAGLPLPAQSTQGRFPPSPYVNVIPVLMIAPPGAVPYAPFTAVVPARLPPSRSREQALKRYQEKRDRRRSMTTLKGGKALVATTRPRDAHGHFTPETSVSEQISEIRRRIQENESANSQMRSELQKKMEELESIRKQTRDSDPASVPEATPQ